MKWNDMWSNMFDGTFRQSLNDIIRTDKPESPTDAVLLFGSFVLLGLQIYATQIRITQPGFIVPHFTEMLVALGAYKSVKVASNYQNAKDKQEIAKINCDCVAETSISQKESL